MRKSTLDKLTSYTEADSTYVVYFDQRMHACSCVSMVENDKKHLKIMKKVHFPSCTQKAHVRLIRENEEKSLLVYNCKTVQAVYGLYSFV